LIIQRVLYRLLRNGAIAGLLLLSLAASACAQDQPPPQGQRILVLGDSISAAYGMSLEQGWVALLQGQLQADHPDHEVINASISGDTTNGGLRRLPALLAQHNPNLVIIELGGNDGLRGFPLTALRSNLDKLVNLSVDHGARVILLPMEIPPNYGTRYTAGFRESYVKVAEATGSTLAPFLLEGVATNRELMQADGIHPNARAQPLLLNNVLPVVLEVLARG
jgi:acyl-CoA thioesterase I